jgi:hypothetical protein
VQDGSDLRARTVNHDHLVPGVVKLDGVSCSGRRDAPAELEHDAGHVVYSAFSRT